MMSAGEDLKEKKLRGSGGYVIAQVTDEEQKKGNLGGPELFLAGIGRLPDDRFVKYHCNKCEIDFNGSPKISYENPNEDLGEGVILFEKGEYKCGTCNSIIAQYRKFDSTDSSDTSQNIIDSTSQSNLSISTLSTEHSKNSYENESRYTSKDEFVSIQSLIGMPAYDHNAMLLGNVQEIGLKRIKGKIGVSLKISKQQISEQPREILWEDISKIGDIILLSEVSNSVISQDKETNEPNENCPYCNSKNESDALFCVECGKKLG